MRKLRARIDPRADVIPGWSVARADFDPSAGPVWAVEHAAVKRELPRRLIVVFADRRPWGDTVEWLIEVLNRIRKDDLVRGPSSMSVKRVHERVSRWAHSHGAVGKLASRSVQAVADQVTDASADPTWAFIDREGELDDHGSRFRAARNGDIVRVRMLYGVKLSMRRGRLSMTDCIAVGCP